MSESLPPVAPGRRRGPKTPYQGWLLFGLAVASVLLHHGVPGTFEPTAVHNHPAAVAHPRRWAAVHGVAVLAAAWAGLTAWRLNEQQALQDGLTGVATGRLLAVRAAGTWWPGSAGTSSPWP